MKKLLTLLLALMMVLSLSACSMDAGNSNTAVSGTFEGESTGMQGPVKVSMTVEEGKITAVELTEIHETPSVASVAMTRIPEQMVEHQQSLNKFLRLAQQNRLYQLRDHLNNTTYKKCYHSSLSYHSGQENIQ